MPIKDIDGGLNFQGFNPRILTDRLPKEQYVSKPFYFGGSQVSESLNKMTLSSQQTSKNLSTKVIKKMAGKR